MTFYTFWFAGGQLVGNVALTILNKQHPQEWKIPIYTQWAVIAMLGAIVITLPESEEQS